MASRTDQGLAGAEGPRHVHGAEVDAGRAGPLMLTLSSIDEDPHQPRKADNPGFSEKNLRELAASIALRGVKTPISVRVNPASPRRFLINHGARRFRASRMAGKTTIAAFIDNDYNEADQVVENLQRNELTPREIADYIGRELAKGCRKGEIAKSISKSAAFVSQHFALLDLPDPIAKSFNSGRVKDVTVINELVMLYKREPVEVLHWLGDDFQQLTRGAVKLLRQFLESKRTEQGDGLATEAIEPVESEMSDLSLDADAMPMRNLAVAYDSRNPIEDRVSENISIKNLVVAVMYGGRHARLLLQRRPGVTGSGWLKFDDDGSEKEVSLADVKLVSLLEG